MMDKKIIVKYVEGKASEAERETVLKWIGQSEENRKVFNRIKNLWVLTNLPNKEASARDVALFSKRLRKKQWLGRAYWGGIAASILLLVGFFTFRTVDSYRSQIHFLETQNIVQLEYTTNRGIKGVVTLPDGSRVRLNSDSYIKCPSKFGSKSRNIEFSGEGFFEVVKNPAVPMIINLGHGISVKVTGTTFNLSSYKNDKNISALLLSGKITIVKQQPLVNKEIEVKPNEMVLVQKSDRTVDLTTPKTTFSTLAWKDGWLVFDETPMKEVIKKLERWHGVRIIVKDSDLLDKQFTGKFKEESISQILEMMNKVSLVRYELKDSIVTLSRY